MYVSKMKKTPNYFDTKNLYFEKEDVTRIKNDFKGVWVEKRMKNRKYILG